MILAKHDFQTEVIEFWSQEFGYISVSTTAIDI